MVRLQRGPSARVPVPTAGCRRRDRGPADARGGAPPPQRRSLAGRFLGALGRAVRPGSGPPVRIHDYREIGLNVELIRSYAIQAASEKATRLANETITMLREKREKVAKEDGNMAARNVIARLGKGELRTDAALREQVLDVLVVHCHLIPTARKGHYMVMVPHA